ncbi:hypothetical protein EDC96DRAFT_545517 [Choanephora cucurbitarum]|nr:hypothetical protein EDC96DRAFT_545517 [Choanephora cucurbitarum]
MRSIKLSDVKLTKHAKLVAAASETVGDKLVFLLTVLQTQVLLVICSFFKITIFMHFDETQGLLLRYLENEIIAGEKYYSRIIRQLLPISNSKSTTTCKSHVTNKGSAVNNYRKALDADKSALVEHVASKLTTNSQGVQVFSKCENI